jgi:hypothetical protein
MAQTRTYDDLISAIKAKFGAPSGFQTLELTSIKHLVNSRIQDLYLESDYWENILVIGEERVVDDTINTIPYTGAFFDATDGISDGNPYSGGAVDTFMRVHKEKPWSSKDAAEYEFAGNATGARLVGYSAAYGFSQTPATAVAFAGTITLYVAAAVDAYVGGTVEVEGFATGTVDINGTHTITATTLVAGTTTIDYTITDTTSHTFSLTGDETFKMPTAWVTYKKRIVDTTYGDGAGETSAIPLEWFECVACGVVADLHSGDGEEAKANKWEQKYQYALDLRIERLDALHGPQTVGQSIFTHLSEQGRSISY